ncbi:MAG TPA: alpha/beta hydrolase domain-containing protein, partial [Bryobacteraceae bacterium]|nr:alpha/beta hydrolase domain-containing protein [Bryobacteraceae bacterium]
SMIGSTLPFARTRAERQAKGDLRLSVAERYRNRADYLGKVAAAAKRLAADRFLLEPDTPLVTQKAGEQWDYWMSTPPESKIRASNP